MAEPPRTGAVTADTRLSIETARKVFTDVQAAWSKGDLLPVRELFTERMFEYLDQQLRAIKVRGLRNIVEIVYFERCDIVDVQEEGGAEVVTVQVEALLRDYTLDSSGAVVEGSREQPVEAKEYWTFLGGSGGYRLDDIQQV